MGQPRNRLPQGRFSIKFNTQRARFLLPSHIYYGKSGGRSSNIYRGDKDEIEELDTEGFFLGVFNNSRYQKKYSKIEPGDKILFYTDGALEVKNDKLNEFGRSRIKRSFIRYSNSGKKGKQILNKFYQEIVKFADDQIFDDDITFLIVERSI